ncbi:hypothetical protein Tco_0551090 [Tanacetum coccineum]
MIPFLFAPRISALAGCDRLGLEEEEEDVPEGQQQAAPVVETAASEPLGHDPERLERVSALRQPTLTTWVDPKDDRVYTDIPIPSPIASPVATPTTTILIDEDQFIEVGVQLEVYKSILYVLNQRLDALPPTLFADIDRDVRQLYTRSGVVRYEIFLQRYKFKSLEHMSHDSYDEHRLIHDMLVQQAAMQRKLQEMRGCVTALEQERGRKEP